MKESLTSNQAYYGVFIVKNQGKFIRNSKLQYLLLMKYDIVIKNLISWKNNVHVIWDIKYQKAYLHV
jgi:hypothetical protein